MEGGSVLELRKGAFGQRTTESFDAAHFDHLHPPLLRRG